jgi:3-dehydroquinate dehydratase/shikimate dehydrogenase
MREEGTVVAELIAPDQAVHAASLPEPVRWLEVRADMVGEIDPRSLRARFSGQLLYTLRSRIEGGRFDGCAEARRQRILTASRSYDLIDLEGERDLVPAVLDAIPPARRVISWHGRARNAQSLQDVFDRLSVARAHLFRLIPDAEQAGDELEALLFLKRLGRRDTTAYSSGNNGFWTRLLAPRFGAPVVFAQLCSEPGSHAEPNAARIVADYGFPGLQPVQDLFGIIGDPVFHSLSPRVHNAAYRMLGRSAIYVPFCAPSFGEFWRNIAATSRLEQLGMRLCGLTVASPHKEAAPKLLHAANPVVRRARSSNLAVLRNGVWNADTTDPEGVCGILAERGVAVRERHIAVIGCGGSGRAIAAALDDAGAQVTLVNRGMERGRFASALLGLSFVPLDDFSADDFSVVVHATPVGRETDDAPFDLQRIRPGTIVVDLVYGSRQTPLVAHARAMGCPTMDGRDVLFAQVRRQFQMMTGSALPQGLPQRPLKGEFNA